MTKYYAGIGSRETPSDVMAFMTISAWFLSTQDYILRSGGADGADSACELGSYDHLKEIFLPYKNFNKNKSPLYLEAFEPELVENAYEMAKKYRPGLEGAGKPTHKFMTRNMMQINGLYLVDPVDFVLCWTQNGKDIGGTGAAIRCAKDQGIEVFNIYNPKEKEAFLDLLRGMEFMSKLSGNMDKGFEMMDKLFGEIVNE
jgi:hypothetical protein